MNARPRCSVFIAMSLDGFIAREDGSVDWLSAVQVPGEDYGYQAFFDTVDALVLGRKTYELALGFEAWPYAGKRVVVMTGQRRESRHGETFHAGPVEAAMDGLSGARHVYVDGGATIRSFLRVGLIDDVTVSMVPVLLGRGVALFGEGAAAKLRLESSRAYPSGLVQLRYARVS